MLEETCARLGRRPLALSVTATQALFLHDWPGNVRELKNALDFAAASAPDNSDEIESWHLPAPLAMVARRACDSALGPVLRGAAGPREALETLPESLELGMGVGMALQMEMDAVAAGAEPEMASASSGPPSGFRPIADEVRELERTRMIEALRATGGVHNRAAERIGMPGRTFATKLKRYRITPDDWSK
jgi:two-component system, NtrC family, response regulator AtoC